MDGNSDKINEPDVVAVVGTAEFAEAWKALLRVVDNLTEFSEDYEQINAAAEAACRRAYEAGFDEGLSK